MNIEIESLTVPEKLALVDRIWSSLHASPDLVPSPEWHKEELATRLQRLESGQATVSPLSEVKARMEKPGD